MQQIYADPNLLPEAARVKLAQYHGEDRWPQVIRNWAGAWIELYQRAGDLYRDRLAEIRCPVLIIHGAHDEHTPVAEMEELDRRIPHARLVIYPDGGHSLHDQRETREACTQLVKEFLQFFPVDAMRLVELAAEVHQIAAHLHGGIGHLR